MARRHPGGPSRSRPVFKGFASFAGRSPAARLDAPHPRMPHFGPESLSFALKSLFCLVKAFKSSPREHVVVRKLQQGQSPEAAAILDEFLAGEGQEW